MFRGCSGVFRGIPGVFHVVSKVFPVCSGVFRVCSAVFRECSRVFQEFSTVFRGRSGYVPECFESILPGFTDTSLKMRIAIFKRSFDRKLGFYWTRVWFHVLAGART